MTHLFIKNMVCDRCKASVKQTLDALKVPYQQVELGEVTMARPPEPGVLVQLKEDLAALGFELIEDKNSRIISQIKTAVIDLVRNPGERRKLKLSVYLSELLHKDYDGISSLFSGIEGVTIEQFFILQKIEYVKELLVYNEHSLSQIAAQLRYSSVQHLSSQFKKVTGLTPSHFRAIGNAKRVSLDKV